MDRTLTRHRIAIVGIGAALACVGLALWTHTSQGAVGDDDWPTYNRDARRSAVSPGTLDVRALRERWVYSSRLPVQSAWPGPAKRDYYRSPTVDNEDRLDFDSVYQAAAVGDSVFFGSSGEDSLRCLDARSGEPRWTYTTNGPVRFAPHVVGGRVYFGSDDGCIYCVRAADGELIWRHRVAPSDYQVPSDGKMISLWPNRTGVVVQDGIVYCAVGVFPSEGVYVCALDAETGSESGPGCYRIRHTDISLQGYVLASSANLYFPAGRDTPVVFDRKTGQCKGRIGGGGGTYALVTTDESIVYGPGKTSAVLEEFRGESRDKLASFPGGKHLVVAGERCYISTRSELFVLERTGYIELSGEIAKLTAQSGKADKDSDEYTRLQEHIADLRERRERCIEWRVECRYPDALILVGGHLIAGGPGAVAAFRASDGSEVWTKEVDGVVKGLAAARGRLFVSTDARKIYCFE